MSEETKRIIEINGVKLEVDLRNAKQINQFKIGDKVKVLVPGYNDQIEIWPGMIVGFDDFKSRPAIVVAYLETSYNSASIKIVYVSNDSKIEITAADEFWIPITKSNVIDIMDREINKKELELIDLQNKKEFFLKRFGKYFPAESE